MQNNNFHKEIKNLIKTANYNELEEILKIAQEAKNKMDQEMKEKAWFAVRDAIKTYTKAYGCITVDVPDEECVLIENDSNFGTIGEIGMPEW